MTICSHHSSQVHPQPIETQPPLPPTALKRKRTSSEPSEPASDAGGPPKRARSSQVLPGPIETQPPSPPTAQKRKRTSSEPSEPAADTSGPLKRARLTKENLRLHRRSLKAAEKMGRTRKTASGSSPTNTSDKSTVTSTDPRFGDQLQENGVVYGLTEAKRPKDADQIETFLNRARKSPVPDEGDWKFFRECVEDSINESSLQLTTWFQIAKLARRDRYTCRGDFLWTEVEDSPVTSKLSPAKPDVMESYRHGIYPTHANEALGWALAPTGHNIAMPTFAAELKCLKKGMDQAMLQSAYDGAIMADAARATQGYLGNEFNYQTTQALTVAFNGDLLNIYADHIVEKESSTEFAFHHTQLFSHSLGSLNDLRAAFKHVRNAQDWCHDRASATLQQLRQYQPPKVAIAAPLTPPQSTPPKVSPETENPWIWSGPHQKYYRLLLDTSLEWTDKLGPMPAPASKKSKLLDSPPDSPPESE